MVCALTATNHIIIERRKERNNAMEKQNGRQSNFELLRVICMISIVSIHLYKQTDAVRLELEDGAPYFFILFLGYGGRLVCNCFVMIGAWFLCDARFKADRIVKLWLYVFSYTTIITITCTLLNIQWGGYNSACAVVSSGYGTPRLVRGRISVYADAFTFFEYAA